MIIRRQKRMILCLFIMLAGSIVVPQAMAQLPVAPLSNFPPRIFEDPQIQRDFIADRTAAVRLGKALFWDMQVGSDGVQACASCHFHAGADPRFTNQLAPGQLGGDQVFGNQDFPLFGPNYSMLPTDFPFHERVDQNRQDSPILRDVNDVVSSMGVVLSDFVDIIPGSAEEITIPLADPVFNVNGLNVRRVEPRNSPSVINAVFNFENFHDGRAKNVFNGVNPFGHLDPDAAVLDNGTGSLQEVKIRIRNSSLASQAVGPPLSDFEMSASKRTFAKIGKKMLSLNPLPKQRVHPNDSILGQLADTATGKGLTVTYADLIRQAFRPRWWNAQQIVTFAISDRYYHEPTEKDPRGYMFGNGDVTILDPPGRPLTTDEFTQMEANFALFFGLAIQLYESTLVADNTPFDRFLAGNTNALNDQEQTGLGIFLGQGGCIICHVGVALTGASVMTVLGLENPAAVEGPIEFMNMVQGTAFYDTGYYNISLRPTAEDVGRGETTPTINPLTGQPFPISHSRLAMLKEAGQLPLDVAQFVPDLPAPGASSDPPNRVAVDGAMKAPGLRNVELTGPYVRTGSEAILEQVVELYSRGGNFPALNIDNHAPAVRELGFNEDQTAAVVAFLRALTDERVRNEGAPFDHPELFVPNGHAPDGSTVLFRITPVGAQGRSAEGLGPLQAFLTPLESQHLPEFAAGADSGAAGGGGGGGGCFISALAW
jgi:cytochrome c peroxidase